MALLIQVQWPWDILSKASRDGDCSWEVEGLTITLQTMPSFSPRSIHVRLYANLTMGNSAFVSGSMHVM